VLGLLPRDGGHWTGDDQVRVTALDEAYRLEPPGFIGSDAHTLLHLVQ